MIVALYSGRTAPVLPAPFAAKPPPFWTSIGTIAAPVPKSPGELPPFPEELKALVRRDSATLLFPATPEDVGAVDRSWVTALEGESWYPAPERPTHLAHVGMKVADNPRDFQSFLLPEQALWDALHSFHGSPATDLARAVVQETLELGEMIQGLIFRPGRVPTHASLQALCDLATRTMILEKAGSMRVLAREIAPPI